MAEKMVSGMIARRLLLPLIEHAREHRPAGNWPDLCDECWRLLERVREGER